MRSILAKIIGLLLAFNLALWAFFLATDDFITNEVRQIKNQLVVTANLYSKITVPVLSNIALTDFEKSVSLQELLADTKLIGNKNLRIFRFENKDDLDTQFRYFDGNEECELFWRRQAARGIGGKGAAELRVDAGAVVALAVILPRDLPVALLDNRGLVRDLGLGQSKRLRVASEHLAHRLEGGRRGGDGDEDVAVDNLERYRL